MERSTKGPTVECRTTGCRIFLDVDLPALIDQSTDAI